MPAFFGCADDKDDVEDGLRIVMGQLDRSRPDIRVSFVIGRTRFILDPKDVIEDFATTIEPPPEWLDRIFCREESDNRPGALHEKEAPSKKQNGHD